MIKIIIGIGNMILLLKTRLITYQALLKTPLLFSLTLPCHEKKYINDLLF